MCAHREVRLLSCVGDKYVGSPLELVKQCQASCRVDIAICGFLEVPMAVTPTNLWSVLGVTVK